MGVPAGCRAGAPANAAGTRKVLVWDAPVRVLRGLLVACFAGAYITAESERWRLVHVTWGYTMGGLVAFRVLWGVFGMRYARFGALPLAPQRALAYLRALASAQPGHHLGHNPAGSLAIYALLVLAAATALTGLAAVADGDEYVLHDEKTYVSNGGIADLYAVVAPTGEAPGAKGLSAFQVPAGTDGIEVVERMLLVAETAGFCVRGLSYSPIRGPKGNIEFLVFLEKCIQNDHATTQIDHNIAVSVVTDAHNTCI